MVRIEYVYEKPVEKKKSHKNILVLIVIIILIAFGFFVYNNFDLSNINLSEFYENFTNNGKNVTEERNNVPSSQEYENIVIPPEYTSKEGLDYVKANYASTVERARNLCTEQFGGEWIDSPIEMGCYNMEGFLIVYCSAEDIQNLRNLCISINGNSTCTPSIISCTV